METISSKLLSLTHTKQALVQMQDPNEHIRHVFKAFDTDGGCNCLSPAAL